MLEKLIAEIKSAPPYGEDLKYDDNFEKVKNQFSGTGTVDLDLVKEIAPKLICEKSKDIRLFSFLFFATIKRAEWSEMADLAEALATLSEKGFPDLHPSRPRAKQLALKWMSEERFSRSLDAKISGSDNQINFTRAKAAFDKLKVILEDNFPDGTPFPYPFYNAIVRWEKESKPKKIKKEPETDHAPNKTASTPTASELTSSKNALVNIRKSALYLIEQEPTKPYGYKLLRTARWGAISKLPPNNGGKTQLNPIRKEQLKVLENSIANSEFDKALLTSEKFFNSGTSHFLLDLQYYSATAADRLGAMYEEVSRAIALETALLIKQYPTITSLTYSDSTPFCSMDTKKWIESEEVAGLLDIDNSKSKSNNCFDNSKELKTVHNLIKVGKKEDAIFELESLITKTGDHKKQIEHYLQISELLNSLKRHDASQGILERLYEEGKNSSLDKWDTELATRIMVELSETYKIMGSNANGDRKIKLGNKRRELIREIAFISPASTLSIV
jgi:type VI secretion system protein VasJ